MKFIFRSPKNTLEETHPELMKMGDMYKGDALGNGLVSLRGQNTAITIK